MPEDPARAKGWVGQLVEDALGAAAASRPVPDFEALGVELKTVPVDAKGQPREATYVTAFPLTGEPDFADTHLARKLERVLFVPVEAEPALPLQVRCIGSPLLWRPDEQQRAALEQDWRSFVARAAEVGIEAIGPRIGQALQVRPKGSSAEDTGWSDGPGGRRRVPRRGLYLRPGFVGALFAQHFLMPDRSAKCARVQP